MSRVVYGLHPVEELLRRRGDAVDALFVARGGEGGRTRALARVAEQRGIAPQRSTSNDLTALCGSSSHQGVAAVVGDFPYASLDDLIEGGGEQPLFVVADSLTDPHNLGAIFRSALVLGARGLIMPRDRAVGVTPAVVRVSAGATEHLPCARVTNLARALGQLKEAGVWVAGTAVDEGAHPADVDLGGALALVVGSEQRGMRPLVRRHCDLLLTLRASGPMGTLNAAVAAAVFLYEASRQRRP